MLTSRRVCWVAALLSTTGFCMTAAWAQAQASGAEQAVQTNWFDHFVVSGGFITYVLLAMSVVSIAMIIQHSWGIRRTAIVAPECASHVRELIEQRKYVDAIRHSAEDPSMLSYVLNAGLLEAGNGFWAMERAMEEALEERSARLLRKIEYLHIIGNVSPMLGLFGTVFGMIQLFAAIREAGAIPDPGTVADKISIALVTTFWGLVVAIMSLSAFGVLRNRIDVLTAECALTCERLLAVFKPGAAPQASGARAAEPAAAGA